MMGYPEWLHMSQFFATLLSLLLVTTKTLLFSVDMESKSLKGPSMSFLLVASVTMIKQLEEYVAGIKLETEEARGRW